MLLTGNFLPLPQCVGPENETPNLLPVALPVQFLYETLIVWEGSSKYNNATPSTELDPCAGSKECLKECLKLLQILWCIEPPVVESANLLTIGFDSGSTNNMTNVSQFFVERVYI